MSKERENIVSSLLVGKGKRSAWNWNVLSDVEFYSDTTEIPGLYFEEEIRRTIVPPALCL